VNAHDAARNLLLYRFYILFNEPLFWGTILITSLQKLAHMPLADIYYMESAVLGLCLILDIPSGALADMIGRKKTIIIGRVFLFLSVLFFTTMQTPLEAWTGNILWAIGFSLQSGADTALLYDTLKEHGRQHEFKKIEGRAVGSRLILMAFCALATGFLADVELRLPLWIGLPFTVIPLVAACFFKEPPRTVEYSVHEQLRVLKQGCIFVVRSVEVRWMVGFAALLATTSKVWFFTYNPYFELVNLPLRYYGTIFFCLNVVAWLSSHFAHSAEQYLGERTCIIGMILCVGIPILLMGAVPILPFAYLVIIQNIVRGFMRPFVGDYMNRHITSDVRATALSVQSSVGNLMGIIGLALFGHITDTLGLLSSLVMLGILSIGLGALSYASYSRKIA